MRLLFETSFTCFVPYNGEHKQAMTKQQGSRSIPALTSEEVNLRFLQLRSEFRKLGIDNPNPFIRWKKPELSDGDEKKIMLALCGRGNAKMGRLIPVVEDVLQQLVAA